MVLCIRLSNSDEDYWKYLRRLLGFVKGTINDKKYIEETGTNYLWTWVGASYAVHGDIDSHTGG